MKLAFALAWRSVRHARWRSALLVLALGLTAGLPLTVGWLVDSYATGLRARAAATPLVLGSVGSRFDLVLTALWFRQNPIKPLPYAEIERLNQTGEAVAIPLHVRFSARGAPVIGTTPEYFEHRRLQTALGQHPLRIGDVVVGAEVAHARQLKPGDALLTDQKDVYNLAAAYPLELRVSGVLAPTGGPDDSAVFVDLKTAWIIAGLGHGHAPDAVESGARRYQRITDANRHTFHAHGDPGGHPVTAALVLPRDAKARTVLKARINVAGAARLVSPGAVVDELLGVVVQVQRFLDANYLVIGISVALLIGLIMGLSIRMRAAEWATFDALGAPRHFAVRLFVAEWLILALAAGLLALGVTLIATWALPDLTSLAR